MVRRRTIGLRRSARVADSEGGILARGLHARSNHTPAGRPMRWMCATHHAFQCSRYATGSGTSRSRRLVVRRAICRSLSGAVALSAVVGCDRVTVPLSGASCRGSASAVSKGSTRGGVEGWRSIATQDGSRVRLTVRNVKHSNSAWKSLSCMYSSAAAAIVVTRRKRRTSGSANRRKPYFSQNVAAVLRHPRRHDTRLMSRGPRRLGVPREVAVSVQPSSMIPGLVGFARQTVHRVRAVLGGDGFSPRKALNVFQVASTAPCSQRSRDGLGNMGSSGPDDPTHRAATPRSRLVLALGTARRRSQSSRGNVRSRLKGSPVIVMAAAYRLFALRQPDT